MTLIGANGAGKSTTLRAIAGVMLPRSGIIRLNGRDITYLPSHERAGWELHSFRKGAASFRFSRCARISSSGRSNTARTVRRYATCIEQAFDMFPRLRERTGQNAGTLCGGEQQMLALGRAMMSEPHLVCLDEPSLGLAPIVVQDIFRTIRSINAAGTSILLVEQNARYALEPRVAATSCRPAPLSPAAPATLRQDERVREAYLGRSAVGGIVLQR